MMTVKFSEYQALDWQSQDEVFFDWCEQQALDHTDPDNFRQFIDTMEVA